MKKLLLPYVVVPAIVCGLLTAWRMQLELHSPDDAIMKWVSANIVGMAWMLGMPFVMLRRGLSLRDGLLTALLFLLLFRLPIGAVYAAAWAGKWTVAGTTDPVRYVTDTPNADASTTMVFVLNSFAPVAFGVVIVFALWSATWALAFRGKRPFATATPAAADH